MTTRLLSQIKTLRDNEGYRHILSIIRKDLEVIENEMELLSEGADKTIALAAKFGAYRRALRVLHDEPERAAELLEQWVASNPDKAGRVLEDMATYDID